MWMARYHDPPEMPSMAKPDLFPASKIHPKDDIKTDKTALSEESHCWWSFPSGKLPFSGSHSWTSWNGLYQTQWPILFPFAAAPHLAADLSQVHQKAATVEIGNSLSKQHPLTWPWTNGGHDTWFSKPRIFSQNSWANPTKPGWNRDVEILVINWPGSNCSRRGLQYMTWSECIRSAWQRAKIDLKPHDTTHAIWCNARTLNHEQHPSIFHEYHTTKSAKLFTVLSKYNLLHLLKVEASRDVGTF